MINIYQIWRENWYIIAPILMLGILITYFLVFDARKISENTDRIIELREQKAMLKQSLNELDFQWEGAVCMGEELVIPTGNIEEIMPPQNASEVVSKLENSVVLVLSGNGEEIGFGSGFFVTPSKIVTNGHVVIHSVVSGSEIYIVNSTIGVRQARVIDIQFEDDSSEDFALLSIQGEIGKPLTIVNLGELKNYKLSEVLAAGFPGAVIQSDAEFIKMLKMQESSVPDLVITDGTISSYQKVFGEVSAFVHTAQISEGNSGGPLVNFCGEVMGVNTFINASDDGIRNFSQISSELLRFLSRSGLTPRVAARECK